MKVFTDKHTMKLLKKVFSISYNTQVPEIKMVTHNSFSTRSWKENRTSMDGFYTVLKVCAELQEMKDSLNRSYNEKRSRKEDRGS